MACGGSTATNLITEFCFVPVAMCKYKQTPLRSLEGYYCGKYILVPLGKRQQMLVYLLWSPFNIGRVVEAQTAADEPLCDLRILWVALPVVEADKCKLPAVRFTFVKSNRCVARPVLAPRLDLLGVVALVVGVVRIVPIIMFEIVPRKKDRLAFRHLQEVALFVRENFATQFARYPPRRFAPQPR